MVAIRSRRAALAAVAAAAVSGSAVAASCPSIEVRAVAPHDRAGARTVPLQEGGSIAVGTPPLISSRDIVEAKVDSAEGQTGLSIRVDRDAAERVRLYTAGHVGAGLAFIVEGRVHMVLKIRDPIAYDAFWISPMDPDAAKTLVAALHDCSRP